MFFKILRFLFWLSKRENLRKKALSLVKSGNIGESQKIVYDVTSEWGRVCLNISEKNCETKIFGLEKIPKNKAVVFMPNHQSYHDITALLACLERPIGFIAKNEIKKIPYLPGWMDLMHCVWLIRDNPRQTVKAMEKAVENVKAGFSLVIFPEGTRTKTGEIATFKPGSFKLALRAKVPIVPVTINGTRALLEDRNHYLSPKKVEIYIHDPIETAELTKAEIIALPEKVRKIVLQKYKQINKRK